jgi:drug/metabolite transporter (DMT)-like permease
VTVNAVRSVIAGMLRSVIAGMLLVACVVSWRGPVVLVAMSASTFVLLAVSIVAAIAIGDTVFFESTRAIGLGRAMTIATTYPVGAALLAAALFGERITVAVAAGTLLTLTGVGVIVSGHAGDRRPRASGSVSGRPWWPPRRGRCRR